MNPRINDDRLIHCPHHEAVEHRVRSCEEELEVMRNELSSVWKTVSQAKEERLAAISDLNLKIEKVTWKVGLLIGAMLFIANMASKYVFP